MLPCGQVSVRRICRHTRPIVRHTIIALLGLASLAWARYEIVPGYEQLARTPTPPECHPAPGSVVSVATADQSTRPTALQGVVVDEHHRPIASAIVGLAPYTTRWALTDSLGRFSISDVIPGRYRVRATHIGHSAAIDSITVTSEVARSYSIVLPVALVDGPCSVVVMRKKPWWKWW